MTERAADTARGTELLCALVYELLDAHADTLELAAGHDLAWDAHLDYLRALQRRAREILARSTPSTGPS